MYVSGEFILDAQKRQYAIPAFNVYNLETMLAVVRAAAQVRSPVVIECSESALEFMGLYRVVELVRDLALREGKQIPIALHLDHGQTPQLIEQCIRAGFSSVHIDASQHPLEKNMRLVEPVVEMAHANKVWVQGEVGHVLGDYKVSTMSLGTLPLTEPTDAKMFVEETGVDELAVAVGTAHGVYTQERIDPMLVAQIRMAVSVPLVLHGSSGNDPKKIQEAIANGICKINVGTDVKRTYLGAMTSAFAQAETPGDPRAVVRPAIEAVAAMCLDRMHLFGSVGKA
ncbi:MAG: class II fructose-bisphosphate aldolase [Patescibacteria group bacterium]